MSEERFDQIDVRLDRLEAGQVALRADVAGLTIRVDGMDRRLDGVDHRLDGLNGRIDDLDRLMHVLHEEAMTRIAAIREYDGPTRGEWLQGMAELREAIDRRLDPLGAVVKQHSVEIDRLKRRRR